MFSYYLTIEGPEEADAALLALYHRDYFDAAKAVQDVVAVRAFQAASGDVAFFDDEGAPRLLLQLLLDSTAGLRAGLANGTMARLSKIPVPGCTITHQLFEIVEEPLPVSSGLGYGKARLSFVVRYYASDRAEKIEAFRRAYLDGHPPALANFPGIRRIFCYVPVKWDDPSDIPGSNCIIGNEVVFDSLEDLNNAIASPAMALVAEHSRAMPRFQGSSTHFPMTLVHEWTGRDR